jgi:hypothetical protein
MSKILKVEFPDKCNDCELCVFEVQRQLNKIGLEGALVRILKNKPDSAKSTDFFIELDPRVSELDLDKILAVCPRGAFKIVDEGTHEFNS